MDKEFLTQMIKCISPAGKEEMLQKCVYTHYKEDFERFVVDEQGTLTGINNEKADFKIMLAAHADEISMIVTGINSDGTLELEANGGIKAKLYVGTKVKILTENGIVNGIVAMTDSLCKKESVKASDLCIDIGCKDKEDAMKYVNKGAYVVHDTDIMELANGRFAGRAFDDRAGVYIIFEAAKKAAKMGTKAAIYTTATTGEENTGRGAFSSASRIKPDVCVAVDVTYANDYKGSDEPGDVELGKGGVICRGSIPNEKLNKLLEECAKELDLPVQFEVFAGRTCTDADTMLKTNSSVPQVLFSIPLRYMHSPVEVLDSKDVDSMIDILALFLTKLDEKYSLLPFTID